MTRSPSPRHHKSYSRGRHNPSTRSSSPSSNVRRRERDPTKNKKQPQTQSLYSTSRAHSEGPDDGPKSVRGANRGRNLYTDIEPSVLTTSQNVNFTMAQSVLSQETMHSSKQLPIHPPPSGPRRPRTPTGPRTRSPLQNRGENYDEAMLRRGKGKGREILREDDLIRHMRDRSASPHRPRCRARWSRSRSRSDSRSSTSRSLSSRSRSPRTVSHSPTRSHSQQTNSEGVNSRGPRRDQGDRAGHKLPNIDDLITPLPIRESRTATQDAEVRLKTSLSVASISPQCLLRSLNASESNATSSKWSM